MLPPTRLCIWLSGLMLISLPVDLSAQLSPDLVRKEIDPKLTEVWTPRPAKVSPGNGTSAPSDAIVLFDGTQADAFQHKDGSPTKWKVADGALTVVPGTGSLFTKQTFEDCQLHLEFRIPVEVEGKGQNNGNSGVFLQSRYEIQVLGSYDSETYANGQCGAIYKQSIPLVNASRPKMEWQSYDIIYQAPVFNQVGHKISPAYVSILHNGVLIQHHVEIKGTTEYRGMPANVAHGSAPLFLQDHGNPVSYRNIWIREL